MWPYSAVLEGCWGFKLRHSCLHSKCCYPLRHHPSLVQIFTYFFWDWWCRIAITTTRGTEVGGSAIQGQRGLQSNFSASLEQLNETNSQNKTKWRYNWGYSQVVENLPNCSPPKCFTSLIKKKSARARAAFLTFFWFYLCFCILLSWVGAWKTYELEGLQ